VKGFRRLALDGCTALVAEHLADSVEQLLRDRVDCVASLLAASRPAEAHSGRAGTHVLALPGTKERVHLRPARRGGVLRFVLPGRLGGRARAEREVETAARLFEQGVPVSQPALALGQRRGLSWQGLFGSIHLEGARNGAQFLATNPSRLSLRIAARAAGRAVRQFHDAGAHHPDLHVENLLVRETDGELQVVVIDLDRAHIGASCSDRARMRQLMRLYRSLVKRDLLNQVGTRGCAAFLAAYCGGDRGLRSRLSGHLRRERLRVAIHALAYPRGRQTRVEQRA
jgi:tRNA A-37 threonylcarbamoyl transferase component Bud32